MCTSTSLPVYNYEDVRKHRTAKDAWIAVHGKVYDITSYIPRHPGGKVLLTGLGRDATTLFETHHNLCNDMASINKVLSKYQIGTISDYKPHVTFDTKFSKELLRRCKEKVKGRLHRESLDTHLSLAVFACMFIGLLVLAFKTGSLWTAPFIGFTMSVGHSAGHAGNHWSLSNSDTLNAIVSMLCTNLWGLREKYWEYSHLISHHCYNYTERDYIMEQHVPMQYFRIRPTDPWRPIHRYQHILYKLTPLTSLLLGSLRFDCFPWIVIAPFLSKLKRNQDSPVPAPQFFASGSNCLEDELHANEDGVGPEHYLLYDTDRDTLVSLVLANIIWLPLFLTTFYRHGFIQAVLLNSLCFGFQSAFATRSLLVQHLCEDIKLDLHHQPSDDWYVKQIEASTCINRGVGNWLAFGASQQIEHHIFPCLNPKLILEVQPIVREVCQEFGVQYKYFDTMGEATASAYNHFKELSVPPSDLKSE